MVGIAGPGDPFANAAQTLETCRRVRDKYPDMMLCLATNGLNLAPHVDELARLKVSHVTVTVNAVDPAVGANIYSWMRVGKRAVRADQGAEILLERQMAAIGELKARNIIVKINSIIIPGINDHHIPEVARKMADLNVDLFNCHALLPQSRQRPGIGSGAVKGERDRNPESRREVRPPRCAIAPAAGRTPLGFWARPPRRP